MREGANGRGLYKVRQLNIKGSWSVWGGIGEKRKQDWEGIPHRVRLWRGAGKEDILQEVLLCDVLRNLKGLPGKICFP